MDKQTHKGELPEIVHENYLHEMCELEASQIAPDCLQYYNRASNVQLLDPQTCLDQFGFHIVNHILFNKPWHKKFIARYLKIIFPLNPSKVAYKENLFKYLLLPAGPVTEKTCVKHIDDRLGHGVVAMQSLEPDTYVGEYAGEFRLVHCLSARRDTRYMMRYPIPVISSLGVALGVAIDALDYGNFTRFINHSSQPNSVIKVAYDGIMIRLLVVTNTKVKEGDELRLDYGIGYWGRREAPML